MYVYMSHPTPQLNGPTTDDWQVGLKHQTEADKAAAARAKKDAKDREDAELKLLFAQLQSGAQKKSKAAEAAAEVRVRVDRCGCWGMWWRHSPRA